MQGVEVQRDGERGRERLAEGDREKREREHDIDVESNVFYTIKSSYRTESLIGRVREDTHTHKNMR